VGNFVVLVNEFDDGWGYCEKVGDPDGSAGVVPLECLDRTSPVNHLAEPSLGMATDILNPYDNGHPLAPEFAPSSVLHTTISSNPVSGYTGAQGGNGHIMASGESAPLSLEDTRVSARFSSFHVDFETIRSSTM
jgi:hypothetical protein